MRERTEIISNALALVATGAISAYLIIFPPASPLMTDSGPADEVSIAIEAAPAQDASPPTNEAPAPQPSPDPLAPTQEPPPPQELPPPPPVDQPAETPPPAPVSTPTPVPTPTPTAVPTPTPLPSPSPLPTPKPAPTLTSVAPPKPRPATQAKPHEATTTTTANSNVAQSASAPARASSGSVAAFRSCLQAHARYPNSKEARLENPRGTVAVSVSLSGGQIVGVEVNGSSGSAILDQAARSSVLNSGCGGMAGGASALTGRIAF